MNSPARIDAVHGDITTEQVDAIVNAANSSLMGGGGVDGAVHRAAGVELLNACRELRSGELPRGLPVGQAVATTAGRLPAAWAIHTVGPNRYAGQDDPELLAAAFRNSLDVAVSVGARSVAFPAIGGGVYGWDMADVARIAVATTGAHPAATDGRLDLIRFVLFSVEAHRIFTELIDHH